MGWQACATLRAMRRGIIGLLVLALAGCGGEMEADAGFATDAGGATDAGAVDGGAADEDAGLDAGGVDGGPGDAGGGDAGMDDAGASDAGSSDAGMDDAGSTDAGMADAGASDAGGDAGACVVMTTAPVTGDAFSGSAGCGGVDTNTVIRDSAALAAHNADYCSRLMSCVLPPPPCPSPPSVDLTADMLVYVWGSASGCSAEAEIVEVRDCGTRVEVDYRVTGIGFCAAIINAWDSVTVPDRGAPVTFNRL